MADSHLQREFDMGTQERRCVMCKEVKPFSEFYMKQNGQPRARCKPCLLAYNKATLDRDRWREYDRRRGSGSSRQSAESKQRRALRKYLMTLDEYAAMHTAQSGVCRICGEAETIMRWGKPTSLAVDHCHKTGKVRGLLCNRCNLVLGKVHDNAEILDAAAAYLRGAGK